MTTAEQAAYADRMQRAASGAARAAQHIAAGLTDLQWHAHGAWHAEAAEAAAKIAAQARSAAAGAAQAAAEAAEDTGRRDDRDRAEEAAARAYSAAQSAEDASNDAAAARAAVALAADLYWHQAQSHQTTRRLQYICGQHTERAIARFGYDVRRAITGAGWRVATRAGGGLDTDIALETTAADGGLWEARVLMDGDYYPDSETRYAAWTAEGAIARALGL